MVTSDYYAITFNTQRIIQMANVAYTNQPGNLYPQSDYGLMAPQHAYAEGANAIPNQPNPFPIAHATFSPDVQVATADAEVK